MKSPLPPSLPSPKTLADVLRTRFPSAKPGRFSNKAIISNGNTYPGRESWDQIDIISPALCDDLLDYLAPTLEKYKGCTIIDFHPGASVWSSKLHNFLQPKRHVLIEPDGRYYDDFIKPLLDQPHSTYRHTFFSEHHPHSYFRAWKTIANDRSLLDERPSVQPDGPQQRAFDPNVLVTGNLARRYEARAFNISAGSLSYSLARFVSAALRDEAFHGPGLVRQLWWFPEKSKQVIVPPRLRDQQATTAGFDMAFSTSEVAGVTPYPMYSVPRKADGKYDRLPRVRALDTLNEAQVAKRMTAANVVVPKTRSLLKADESILQELGPYKSPFSNVTSSAADLQLSISLVRERLRCLQAAWYPQNRRLSSMAYFYLESIEYPQARRAFDTWQGTIPGAKTHSRLALLTDMALRILNLEVRFKEVETNEPDNPDLAQTRDTIIAFGDDLNELGDRIKFLAMPEIEMFLDEEIAAHTVDGVFNFQKRLFEPLKACTHDFWPQKELTLMDITPRTIDFSVPGLASQADGARFCYTLLKNLYNRRRSPLPVILDKMAINAGKDLIPMVPAITDVRKGGRLNPMRMSPLMLTHEMVAGLVKAFFEWPFRPPSWELDLVSESAVLDPFNSAEPGEEVEAEEVEEG